MFSFFINAWIIGFMGSAIIGPIGMLFIQKTLKMGMKGAIPVGLGAALTDCFYCSIVTFGLSALFDFLLEKIVLVRITGGVFLLYLAYREFKINATSNSAQTKSENALKLMIEVFFLDLTNPLTILFFISIFANLSNEAMTFCDSLSLIFGIFIGSIMFYLISGIILARVKGKIPEKFLSRLKYISAIIVAIFGLHSIITAIIKLVE
ncbi:amino acid transporter [Alphaproteobacteria bacterium]|nr:amino acid transporter [Alphaproteobacteria bacterium]